MLQTISEDSTGNYLVRSHDLRTDHDLFRRLLNRFEVADRPRQRREIMELVVDLFELHSAIESQVYPAVQEVMRERDAVYDLMEQVEGTDASSQLHLARGLELKRAFEAYIELKESLERRPIALPLRITHSNRNILEERNLLIDQARQLLRLH